MQAGWHHDQPATAMHSPPPNGPIDPDDAAHPQAWLDHFGITAEQLREAVSTAGDITQAVTEHLLNESACAGAA